MNESVIYRYMNKGEREDRAEMDKGERTGEERVRIEDKRKIW